LARSKTTTTSKKGNRLLYLVPVLAVVLTVAVYAIAALPTPSNPPVMNYTVQLSIQVASVQPNGTRGIQFIIPQGVGEAGLSWYAHTYDGNGLQGRYPLYIDPPAGQGYPGYSLVHVVSSVYHNYTMGDLFAVWGKSLGQNDTIGVQAQNGNQWSMCVGPSRSGSRPGLWGQEPLVNYNTITLLYDNIGCL